LDVDFLNKLLVIIKAEGDEQKKMFDEVNKKK